jgi:hypothetical protein
VEGEIAGALPFFFLPFFGAAGAGASTTVDGASATGAAVEGMSATGATAGGNVAGGDAAGGWGATGGVAAGGVATGAAAGGVVATGGEAGCGGEATGGVATGGVLVGAWAGAVALLDLVGAEAGGCVVEVVGEVAGALEVDLDWVGAEAEEAEVEGALAGDWAKVEEVSVRQRRAMARDARLSMIELGNFVEARQREKEREMRKFECVKRVKWEGLKREKRTKVGECGEARIQQASYRHMW